jgi:cytochrome oxidase Cu insertion factor (SCO1/SenC/PrrC family)
MRHSLKRYAWTASIACLVLGCLPTHAHEPAPEHQLDFTPPAPGTYHLHVIMRAPEGEVLDTTGNTHPLSEFTHRKVTLLGLIYTRCADPDGCPRAWAAFADVRRALKSNPRLARQTRFVSLSFDPAHDTPDVMRATARNAAGRDRSIEWQFLTTASAHALAPILDGFGQDLRLPIDADVNTGPTFTHTLKLFLIDQQGRVREIYTTAYLMPQIVVNDIRTLLMEPRS